MYNYVSYIHQEIIFLKKETDINHFQGGELGYSGDASPHKSHQIPLDKTGSGSIMDPPARGATA